MDFNGNVLEGHKDCEWPQWELFDMTADAEEIRNLYDDPAYEDVIGELKERLYQLKEHYLDFE